MKKIYILSACLFSGAIAFAQNNQVKSKSNVLLTKNTDVNVKNSGSNGYKSGAPFWTEDFANGFAGNNPSGAAWTVTNALEGGKATWEYRGATTSPDQTIGSRGACADETLVIGSPTAANGFMIFDSNYWDDNGPNCGGAVGSGEQAGPQTVSLTSGPIDLSTQTQVALFFSNYARKFQTSQILAQVSVDGGNTFVTVADGLAGIGVNGATAVTNVAKADISAIAGGRSDVRIRFTWSGMYYFSMIDDIYLDTPPATDLRTFSAGNYIPNSWGRQTTITRDAADFGFDLGASVVNGGSQKQQNVKVAAIVTYAGLVIDSLISDTFSININDTAFITFPTYVPDTGYLAGVYGFRYQVIPQTEDFSPADNRSANYGFYLNDSIFANARFSNVPGQGILPYSGSFTTVADWDNSLTACIPFIDKNADRLMANGIYFASRAFDLATTTPKSNEDKRVVAELYEWNDDVTTELIIENIQAIASVEYFYPTGVNTITPVKAEFPQEITLKANQKYLVCVTTDDEEVRFDYDQVTNYSKNYDIRDVTVCPIKVGDAWFTGGFGASTIASIGLVTDGQVGINDVSFNNQVKPFPMPAVESITIPLNSTKTGSVEINVLDLTGKSVTVKTAVLNELGNVKVATADLSAGMYTFVLKFNDNTQSSFKVQINK